MRQRLEQSRLRLFSILVGLVVGYVIAAVTGVLEVTSFTRSPACRFSQCRA